MWKHTKSYVFLLCFNWIHTLNFDFNHFHIRFGHMRIFFLHLNCPRTAGVNVTREYDLILFPFALQLFSQPQISFYHGTNKWIICSENLLCMCTWVHTQFSSVLCIITSRIYFFSIADKSWEEFLYWIDFLNIFDSPITFSSMFASVNGLSTANQPKTRKYLNFMTCCEVSLERNRISWRWLPTFLFNVWIRNIKISVSRCVEQANCLKSKKGGTNTMIVNYYYIAIVVLTKNNNRKILLPYINLSFTMALNFLVVSSCVIRFLLSTLWGKYFLSLKLSRFFY